MSLAETVYEKLTDEEDAPLADDLPEEACRETPKSFALILSTAFLTKLGDALASPKTVLAWVTGLVGAPAWVLGFLVPIRESGSLLPQLFIGSAIRSLPRRKWVWVIGSLVQGAALLGMAGVVVALEGVAAGGALLGLLAAFSLARSFCSVAAKDVLGKTIPKGKRGQLTGWSASAAGLVSLVVGFALLLPTAQGRSLALYAGLLAVAGGLWWIAAAGYARVPEPAGETDGARTALEALAHLRLLASDAPFRRFVITRALLMCSALSAPYYVALAQSHRGSPTHLLGLFVIASGVASLASAPLWGRFADRSSKQVMVAAGLVTSGVGITTFLVDRFAPAVGGSLAFVPAAYFVLCVAHSGVRVGRKTYVVDLASGNRRTDYVAISNSVIGVCLLLVGAIGALAPLISTAGVIVVLAGMGLAGALLGATLPDVSD